MTQKIDQRDIWLAMSGGGFRASLYHFGCLKRFHELGILDRVYGVSATSGGALAAATWSYYSFSQSGDDFDWDGYERYFLRAVRRGLLGPAFLLIAAYAFYFAAWICVAAFGWYFFKPIVPRHAAYFLRFGAYLSLGGFGLHAMLALQLVRDRIHRPMGVDFARQDGGYSGASDPAKRFLGMLFFPSLSRRHLMDALLFKGLPMAALHGRFPRLFLTAFDLLQGSEFVFSPFAAERLTRNGCKDLWNEREGVEFRPTKRLTLATAVAASSAFPPWFKPVEIASDRKSLGSFVDGGIADNLAMNVPRNFASYGAIAAPVAKGPEIICSLTPKAVAEAELYRRGTPPPFKEQIKHVWLLDASMHIEASPAIGWNPYSRMKRVIDVISNQEHEALNVISANFKATCNIAVRAVSLRINRFDESRFADAALNDYLAGVRTHFDSFSPEECAILAYRGYCDADNLAKTELSPPPVQRKSFEKFFDPEFLDYATSASELRAHLRRSGCLIGTLRSFLRAWDATLSWLRSRSIPVSILRKPSN